MADLQPAKTARAQPLRHPLDRLGHIEGLEGHQGAVGIDAGEGEQAAHQLPNPVRLLLNQSQLGEILLREPMGAAAQTAGVVADQADGGAQLMADAIGEAPLALPGGRKAIEQIVESHGNGANS